MTTQPSDSFAPDVRMDLGQSSTSIFSGHFIGATTMRNISCTCSLFTEAQTREGLACGPLGNSLSRSVNLRINWGMPGSFHHHSGVETCMTSSSRPTRRTLISTSRCFLWITVVWTIAIRYAAGRSHGRVIQHVPCRSPSTLQLLTVSLSSPLS